MIAASPPAVCGPVRTAGSEQNLVVYLRTAEGDVALAGPPSGDLVGYAGRVCVIVTARRNLPGVGDAVVVASYRLVGDGRHAPIVGRLVRTARGPALQDDRGKRFPLEDDPRLGPLAGRRVYVTGTWRDGRLRVQRYGVLGIAQH